MSTICHNYTSIALLTYLLHDKSFIETIRRIHSRLQTACLPLAPTHPPVSLKPFRRLAYLFAPTHPPLSFKTSDALLTYLLHDKSFIETRPKLSFKTSDALQWRTPPWILKTPIASMLLSYQSSPSLQYYAQFSQSANFGFHGTFQLLTLFWSTISSAFSTAQMQ
jgi:hypothetical protein